MTILLTVLFLNACSEEQITTEDELQLNQEKIAWLKAIDDYKADYVKHYEVVKKEIDLIEIKTASVFQQVTEIKAERKYFRDNQIASSEKPNHSNGVIKVPGDYASLQEAVDNSEPSGKILVVGALADQGDVYVDVPGLQIMGNAEGEISGLGIYFLAENIEVSHLDLQIKLIIGVEANGAKVLHNNLESLANETEGLILMNNVAGCSIKNNVIRDQGNTLISGIKTQDCSDNEFYSNVIYGGANTFSHMLFNNSTGNEIKNCTIKEGGDALGAGIFFEGETNENVIKGCNIENVGGWGMWLKGDFFNRGENNQILNCTVKKYGGVRGIIMSEVANSIIRNCEVNNKDAVDPDNVFAEGMGLINSTDSTIENCTVKYNSGGGIAIFFNLRGTNSIINCKVNNNGGSLNKSQLGCFGIATGPQNVNGTILIDNCEVNNNISIGDPLPYPFFIRSAISTSYFANGPDNNFSHTIRNCKANNNTGTFATGILAAGFPGFYVGSEVTWNLNNNEANGNKQGIGLSGVDNAVVANNTAQGNSICDFVEDDLAGPVIGTILTNNNFGTTCVVNN